MSSLAKAPDWLKLQRKIFTRWVNQKVSQRGVKVEDVVNDVADGSLLLTLLEVLSEKKYTGKFEKNPRMRVQKIDNINNALNFTWSCGVQVKVKPSAENLADGDEKAILGLIWAVMLKYMKIGDEEGSEQLNAKDALLLWCQNKTLGYKDVKVDNFTTSLHDGLALAAIIHKHRPKLIDPSTMSKENKKENLAAVMDAAEKYFGLEKYLTPDEVLKLDENSMVVYVSEYYYGIAEQRKMDLAARRIAKLIKATKENDALREEYQQRAQKLLEHLKKVEKILEDRTIDNNMAGAKRRIEEFYDYKTKDKNVIIGDQLSLEGVYNTLAMKLAHHKRPEFVPAEGLSLKDIEKAINHLEACEQERKVALHAELNRQLKLVKIDEEHTARYNKLQTWAAEKEAYLSKKESINSVSEAQLHIKLLDAYDQEAAGVKTSSIGQLKKLGAELVAEHYEKKEDVVAREAEVDEKLEKLGQLSQAKRPVLEDDLAREQFKEKVRLANKQHADKFQQLQAWIAEKEAYLKRKEEISSVSQAQTQLTLLEGYEKAYNNTTNTNVNPFKALGEHILAQKYETQYSSWVWETPDEITQKTSTIASLWANLQILKAQKLEVLQDDLARETFKDNVRLLDQEHRDIFNQLSNWIAEKEAYLNRKEVVSSVADAQTQLTLLEAYQKAFVNTTTTIATPFHSLGDDIVAQKYETKHSSWSLEAPEEVQQRNTTVKDKWVVLQTLAEQKGVILKDDLAREQFKERVRLLDQEHQDLFNQLKAWIAEKEAYLNKKETVNSISDAQTQLTLLEAYQKAFTNNSNTAKPSFQQLGDQIVAEKYETQYSSWTLEAPEEVKARNNFVEEKWVVLKKLAEDKTAVLKDDLAREQFKEKVRLMDQEHQDLFNQLKAWIAEKEAYLNKKETVNSVSDAQTQLTLLEAYQKAFTNNSNSAKPSFLQLGDQIVAEKYETQYSSWTLEAPEEVKARNTFVEEKWVLLKKLAEDKTAVLKDDLAREQFKEKVRLMDQEHQDLFKQLKAWIAEKEAYLNKKETINSVGDAQTQLTLLEAYQKAFTNNSNTAKPSFQQLGDQIVAEKYETQYSSWSLETADEVKQRNAFVEDKWVVLKDLAAQKSAVLKDDLAREQFKEKVRLMDQEHQDLFNQLEAWTSEKEAYLNKKEEVNSVIDATTQLTLLDAYETEKASTEGSSVALLQEVGADTLKQKYETTLSQWSIENPAEIQGRESTVDQKLVKLNELSAAKRAVLTEDLNRETEKERLRLEFAHQATEFVRWARETTQEVAGSQFGFDLEEVEAYAAKLQANDTHIQGAQSEKVNEYQGVHTKLNDYGVTENLYTTLNLNHLSEAAETLNSALASRKETYEKELARQRANDAMCKEFAGLAEPFCKAIIDTKDAITHSKEPLEQQLAAVQEKIDTQGTVAAKLPEINAVYQKIEEAGITNNRYTTLTQKDVAVQWEQYEAFLGKKKTMLIEEIEHHKLRGITAEQLKEIEENFKQFDTNNDGILDKKELKACLYSLGEEKNNADIDKILSEFGEAGKGHIIRDGFKNFMVKIYGDTDTKDEILDSFKLINKFEEVAKHVNIELVMNPADVDYFEATAEPIGSGVYDYKIWTDKVFLR